MTNRFREIEESSGSLRWIWKRTVVFLVALFVVGLIILMDAGPGWVSSTRYANESLAVAFLKMVNSCAAAYAADHPEQGFPADLSLLASGGSTCLDRRLEERAKGYYHFSYVVSPPDSKRRMVSYRLSARPLHYGRFTLRSFFSDETAIVHATQDNREATATDPSLD